jgi:hypothetical protein
MRSRINCLLGGHGRLLGRSIRIRQRNGLLHVDFVREIPEAMKPRSIPIASSSRLLGVEPIKVAA